MNPHVDLNSLKRDGVAQPVSGSLVAPPRRTFTRYVVPVLLLVGFSGVAAYAFRGSFSRPLPVRVVMPAMLEAEGGQQGAPLFQAPGWIEPDPFPIILSALIPGVVSKVNVREGDQVETGTVIAELVNDEARLDVDLAMATLARKNAELEAAQANWDHPLSLDEALLMAQAEHLKLAAEEGRASQTLLLEQRDKAVRESLNRGGAEGAYPAEIAALKVRSAEFSLKQVQAQVQAHDATLSASMERSRLRIEDRFKLESARAEVADAEVALKQAKLKLERTRVVAGQAGTIMRLYTTPGAMMTMQVMDGLKIASLYHPDNLQVRAEVPLASAARIRPGLPAEIRVEALPDRVFHGEISRVVHEADVQRNTLPVKVRISEPDPALKPEMIARVQFTAPQSSDEETSKPQNMDKTLFIPASLAPGDAKEAKLWVVGPDEKAHGVSATMGQRKKNDLREVSSGIGPADKIVISGSENLKEGTAVKITASE